MDSSHDWIGIDVGFAQPPRRSTGIAWLRDGRLRSGLATVEWSRRAEVLGSAASAGLAAIDAPLLPEIAGADPWRRRGCERIFGLGRFQRRCKPGLSHVRGTGRRFRRAGSETALQLRQRLLPGHSDRFPQVMADRLLVEAFPNAYLGVLLPDTTFNAQPTLRRGQRFDWLYDEAIAQAPLRQLTLAIDPGDRLWPAIEGCRDHDLRAALVCLLTAGGVARGRYTAVGDPIGGYLFLPPLDHWSPWARSELERQRQRLPELDRRSGDGEALEIWVDGARLP